MVLREKMRQKIEQNKTQLQNDSGNPYPHQTHSVATETVNVNVDNENDIPTISRSKKSHKPLFRGQPPIFRADYVNENVTQTTLERHD